MTTAQIRGEVRKFVIQNFLYGQAQGLLDSASFLETAIIDSTGVLELVSFIETRFAVAVDDADLIPDNLDSVDRVTGFIQRQLQHRGSIIAG